MIKSILKHKSDIKSNKSLPSSSSISSASSSSSQKPISKNVRFDLFSTTIKRFDSDDEPITISNESSPIMSPDIDDNNSRDIYNQNDNYSYNNRYLSSKSFQNNIKNESCWFNNLDILPNLINFDKQFYSLYKKNKSISSSSSNTSHTNNKQLNTGSKSFYKQNDLSLSDFDLDYDDNEDYAYNYGYVYEDEDNDDDITINNLDNIRSVYLNSTINSNYNSFLGYNSDNATDTNTNTNIKNKMVGNEPLMYSNELLISDVDIKWKLIDSNVPVISQSLDLQNDQSIESYLNGQNIKLYRLEQSDVKENKLHGYLIVNNINFEKIIEIKFTFNNWNNIHYISSTYRRSLTSKFDEFQFTIDLNCYKFFLQIKDLLNKHIKIDLCCRYDVGNETYFDNNNYQNYTLKLIKVDDDIDRKTREDANFTNSHRVGSLLFSDTTSSLPSGLSSSSTSSSQYMDPQQHPTDNNVASLTLTLNSLQKNRNDYINSYIHNPKMNTLNDTNRNIQNNSSDKGVSAGTNKSLTTTATTATNNHQYNHPFLVNNKYIVPMTSRQFMNNRYMGHSRTFSEDTDYYNTSPLKHLYHNDTCEFVKKPATINEVLNIETNPLRLPDTLPGPSITMKKFHIDLLDPLNKQSNTLTTSAINDNNQFRGSQEKDKQKDTIPHLTHPLEDRTFSNSSLSSTNSSISFSSFQDDNLTAKKKNSSLTSSTLSSDSISPPHVSASLDKNSFIPNSSTTINANNSIVELNSTNLSKNEANHSINYMNPASNFISRQNSGLSSSSSLISDSMKDFFDIQHPTIEYFNNDLTVPSTSLNSKHILNQQDEIQSVGTDTTFKDPSTISNSNNNTKINDNINIDQMMDNSKNCNSATDKTNQCLFHSNNNPNSVIQSNSFKNVDYQKLLQSYCFYTSPPSDKDPISSFSELSPSSSPGSTLYL